MKSHAALQISAAGIIACSAAFPHAVYGACARGDVDYYLSKGFTHDQVVAICTGAMPKPRRSRASEVPVDPALNRELLLSNSRPR